MTTEEKLKHFEDSAIAKAKSLAENMIREHQNALDKIFADHKADKDRQIALQIKTETDSIKRADNMQLSKEQIKLKRLLTQKTKELKEKLFLEVSEKLKAYRSTEDYVKLLKRQIDSIHETAKNQEVHIYLDVEDASLLEALQAYDKAENAGYQETLIAYLEHGCNMNRTADALFIHRNTLAYRIKRIRAISGIDLENLSPGDGLLRIWLACRILRDLPQ